MAERYDRARLSGTESRAYPEPQGRPVPLNADVSGDSEEVRRYRRFFATHDINGMPQQHAGSWR